jgi:hypothetical protein
MAITFRGAFVLCEPWSRRCLRRVYKVGVASPGWDLYIIANDHCR